MAGRVGFGRVKESSLESVGWTAEENYLTIMYDMNVKCPLPVAHNTFTDIKFAQRLQASVAILQKPWDGWVGLGSVK